MIDLHGNDVSNRTPREVGHERNESRKNLDVLEKETIDEITFRTIKCRNRLILELMARGGMCIGEVLKLGPVDIQDRKLILQEPKSGSENKFVFIPQKVADRLRTYASQQPPAKRVATIFGRRPKR